MTRFTTIVVLAGTAKVVWLVESTCRRSITRVDGPKPLLIVYNRTGAESFEAYKRTAGNVTGSVTPAQRRGGILQGVDQLQNLTS